MSTLYLREQSNEIREHEVAQRWWRLPLGSRLPLSDGQYYRLIFAGHPGGSAGPDVRDAVLLQEDARSIEEESAEPTEGARLVGDVEFHVRSSDWLAHGHQRDPRYNQVVLHVVLICNDPKPTYRQDGASIPTCSLYDLPNADSEPAALWPCQRVMPALSPRERSALLQHAGLLRFEQKTEAFIEQLHAASASSSDELYNACLLPAIGEGLGYGRDRAIFRAAALRLLGSNSQFPEPLGRAEQPAPLDSQRLQALRKLVVQAPGLWQTLHSLFHEYAAQTEARLLSALHAVFLGSGLSLARADILICNIVLPFAAAIALLEHDSRLGTQARTLYKLHPGLPSNRITRNMCAQLQLGAEPQGSCQQQGLHYLYQQTCRAKRCNVCSAARMTI
ncbi:DUF2851 family protein [Ktedonosporobacter rubrisoli]|uniref:DUF2851 family protein n=1 Tax=Ktedonosporobacter rubrisoli TaxID=2509675 RepID=A0A4V0YZE7_KTERU|nr:DUF2851 family protein [Ktedonosporobacter rubrisoli]QBD79461.1 DUF2851 family protein [Ktedonosporobacter rubrisoli]